MNYAYFLAWLTIIISSLRVISKNNPFDKPLKEGEDMGVDRGMPRSVWNIEEGSCKKVSLSLTRL